MPIFDALTVNDTTIKVDNQTDYYLEQWLYSDYGFRLFYRPTTGIEEYYWKNLLNQYNFEDVDDQFISRRTRFVDISTRNRSIDFHEFLSRPFCTEFVSGDKVYAFYFDYRKSTILMSNEETFWDLL